MELNRSNSPANDRLFSTSGTITGGGTLTVNNLGPALQGGDVFTLFSQPVNGFGAINLPSLPADAVWQNNLAVDGSIRVVLTNAAGLMLGTAAGNQLILAWPVDHTGWRLQAQTNDLNFGLGTNWVDIAGSDATNELVLPLDPTAGSIFFRLKYP